jgi:hypothetical protein
VIVHEYRPYYYPAYPAIYHRPYYYDGTVICSGLLTTTSNLTFTNGTYNTINATNSYLVNNSVTTGAINTNTSSFLGSTLSGDASYYSSPASVPIETGRVEKGEKSDQQFTSVDMEFEKNYIHHLVYQVLESLSMLKRCRSLRRQRLRIKD